jgi:hypothetical protein
MDIDDWTQNILVTCDWGIMAYYWNTKISPKKIEFGDNLKIMTWWGIGIQIDLYLGVKITRLTKIHLDDVELRDGKRYAEMGIGDMLRR